MYTDSLNENSGKYGGQPQDVVFVTDAAAVTIQKGDSGKIHVCPDLTADATYTLPSAERGLSYEFWYGGAAADAQDWNIKTRSADEYFVGGLVHHDLDGELVNVVYSDNNSNAHLGVLLPNCGTSVKVVSDGYVWYINGRVVSATDTGVTFADLA